jgi:hypothetical protein
MKNESGEFAGWEGEFKCLWPAGDSRLSEQNGEKGNNAKDQIAAFNMHALWFISFIEDSLMRALILLRGI